MSKHFHVGTIPLCQKAALNTIYIITLYPIYYTQPAYQTLHIHSRIIITGYTISLYDCKISVKHLWKGDNAFRGSCF